MSISLLLEMAASSNPERTAIVAGDLRLTTQQLSDLADGGAGVARDLGCTACRVRRRRRRDAAAADLRLGARRVAVHSDQLPALRRRDPGADPPAARTAGDRRRPLPGHDRRRAGAELRANFSRCARSAEAGRGVRRPGRGRGGAVHLRHHVAAQGRRTHPQQPDQLRHRHSRIRLGRTGRRRADLRAALPHRRGRRGAVQPVRRPKDGVPAQLRRRTSGCGWPTTSRSPPRPWCRPCWTASSPCSRRPSTSCPRCATWPTAAPRWDCRWSAGRSSCCRTSASSTPTA